MTETSALLTDFYQLTMLQAYFEQGMTERAVFELLVRRMPGRRSFLMAAGLEQAIDYLEGLRFGEWELEYMAKSGRFSRDFVDRMSQLRFTGDVHAMPEGSVFFADEPILRVSAPLPEAQLVETRLINILHYQSLIASKGARVAISAPGRLLVDFGLRRAHGAEAGVFAARAAYIAGMSGTSNVLAGAMYGIPVYGTMAHSFIEAHEDEESAFVAFARSHPGNVALLLDTYDTEAAARKVVSLAPKLTQSGITIRAVRLNSGNHAQHARAVRLILNDGGLPDVRIFASGGLDEHDVAALLAASVPIDGFGVGTRLVTSSDVPALDCAYKLMEYAGRPRHKRSEEKATWPGAKQVYRKMGTGGLMLHDTIALAREAWPDDSALLVPVMAGGKRVSSPPTLAEIRQHAQGQLQALPEPLRTLGRTHAYSVKISHGLLNLAKELFAGAPLPSGAKE
ncbi:MAG: nicotinate phosphoribosyltransferase [Deltaproteobacteria bacterium]|nr:nicotinate phosphoribosyltransferase [Deltaproteobacteria bacterium]